MPLVQGSDRASISANIREMLASHHPRAQAIAAALATADRYGKHRAAGGSSGGLPNDLPAGFGGPGAPPNPNMPNPLAGQSGPPIPPGGQPIAPRAPVYSVPSLANQGVLPSGLMKVPQVGNYNLDLKTGALSPETQSLLASYAMRGLPPASMAPGYTPPSTPPPAQSTNSNLALSPYEANYLASITNNPAYGPGTQGIPDSTGGGGSKRGGAIGLATGGAPPSTPWFVRSEAHAMAHPSGLVRGIGGGRTDTTPMSVSPGSHVVPADVLSGIGHGSSNAGAHAMDVAMSSGPGGLKLPKGPVKPMALPRMPHLAKGGEPEALPVRIAKGLSKGGVPCILANDEYLLPPHEVARIEHNGKKSHEAVDSWILEVRGNTIKTMRKLPGPVGAKS